MSSTLSEIIKDIDSIKTSIENFVNNVGAYEKEYVNDIESFAKKAPGYLKIIPDKLEKEMDTILGGINPARFESMYNHLADRRAFYEKMRKELPEKKIFGVTYKAVLTDDGVYSSAFALGERLGEYFKFGISFFKKSIHTVRALKGKQEEGISNDLVKVIDKSAGIYKLIHKQMKDASQAEDNGSGGMHEIDSVLKVVKELLSDLPSDLTDEINAHLPISLDTTLWFYNAIEKALEDSESKSAQNYCRQYAGYSDLVAGKIIQLTDAFNKKVKLGGSGNIGGAVGAGVGWDAALALNGRLRARLSEALHLNLSAVDLVALFLVPLSILFKMLSIGLNAGADWLDIDKL